MSTNFDLVVLGSGPAATRVATRCAKENWNVAVVDPLPVGGTCALRGCNPKKVLVRAAELVDRARGMEGNGTKLGDARIHWQDLIRFKRTFTDPVTESKKSSFSDLDIEIVQGSPRFVDRNALEVEGRTLRGKKFLIATGAAPVELSIEGAEFLTTSAEFMELDDLPERVVFVGGGYISFEFAHVAALASADVTIIDRSQPLAKFDNELVEHLVDRSRKMGIVVKSQTTVESIQQNSDGSFRISISGSDGEQSIEADLVVHGAGRVPNVQGLGLDQADIRFSDEGIDVNEYFQSISNESVYAAGDVVATNLPPLTPVANYQGIAVAKNLMEGNVAKNDNPLVPTAVFTTPALAAVGMTESEANRSEIDCEIISGDWAEFSSMKKVCETHAMYKVLIDKSNDQIVGAHLLGPQAAEIINLFALAMKFNVTASQLKYTPYVFPTFVSDIQSML